jgi:DNA-binding GntR family transcriptional regulator
MTTTHGLKRPPRHARRAVQLRVPSGARYRTKQELVYKTLRDAIMRCDLAPGQRLLIDELARRLEVSAIPVREALQLLQSEGLVVNVPHVGATVAPISLESIHEVFAIMEGLEIVAARGAAERLSDKEAAELEALVSRMDEALEQHQYERWADLNSRFHLAIGRISAMPMLLEMTERVLARWDRLRRYYFDGVLVHRVDQAQAEHHQLVDAMKAKDPGGVERIMRQHNRGALEAYLGYLHAGRAERPAAGS